MNTKYETEQIRGESDLEALKAGKTIVLVKGPDYLETAPGCKNDEPYVLLNSCGFVATSSYYPDGVAYGEEEVEEAITHFEEEGVTVTAHPIEYSPIRMKLKNAPMKEPMVCMSADTCTDIDCHHREPHERSSSCNHSCDFQQSTKCQPIKGK